MDQNVARLETSQRSCGFYLMWFFRLFRVSEHGWQQVQTADGRPIIEQDAFFMLATETIGRKLNEMIAHERWLASQRT